MMGTLFEQRERREVLPSVGFWVAEKANELSEAYDVTFADALKCIEIDMRIADYDVKDEQLAGFGELFRDLINQIDMWRREK